MQQKIEESENPIFEEAAYSDGVLNIEMRGKKYYVLNKQTPNKQIWLSSPISGPSRFEYETEKKVWLHYRTSNCLIKTLNDEFNNHFAQNEKEKIYLKYPTI